MDLFMAGQSTKLFDPGFDVVAGDLFSFTDGS